MVVSMSLTTLEGIINW